MTSVGRTSTFRDVLVRDGLYAALGFLNNRVDFRFTGVYRFDGAILRNVCLFDREAPGESGGQDAPVSQTYCGITGSGGDVLNVENGQVDPRFPWMQGSAVIAYCGVPVFEPRGDVIGTVCHFDLRPCRIPKAELPTIRTAAGLVWTYCLAADATIC
ncbi:GAF domain-containing protein [Ramlibacter sp. CGMCC 1.13660]|uniref:GAF domain-containing protein n=1 Tax=Ramlibacter sp. CGMCC 1.13660 TaxID=2755558 RepID=UPI0012FBDB57|nr:GAF domain-containing protein [Ramlibacter sp. CGMCC 1.13660]